MVRSLITMGLGVDFFGFNLSGLRQLLKSVGLCLLPNFEPYFFIFQPLFLQVGFQPILFLLSFQDTNDMKDRSFVVGSHVSEVLLVCSSSLFSSLDQTG